MGAEKRRIHKEPIARDAAEKPLVHGGHEGQADEEFAIARRELGEACGFEGRIEQPLGGKAGAECLHLRKEPVYPVELLGPDPVQAAQLRDAHRELGNGGQKREQTLGVGRGQGAALLTAPERMETKKGLIFRQGHAAGRLGDTAGPVVVEGKDGREETADPGMDEVMQKVAAAACHGNGRESAHVRVMGAEPLDKGIYGRMEVIRQRAGMGSRMVISDGFLLIQNHWTPAFAGVSLVPAPGIRRGDAPS